MKATERLLDISLSDIVTNLDDFVDPQAVAEEHDLHRLVLQAVDGLSSKDKEATLLFYYEQLTLQEIAALLGISVGTIKAASTGRENSFRKSWQQNIYLNIVRDRGR